MYSKINFNIMFFCLFLKILNSLYPFGGRNGIIVSLSDVFKISIKSAQCYSGHENDNFKRTFLNSDL